MNIRNKSVNYDDKTSISVNGKDIMESDNLELLVVRSLNAKYRPDRYRRDKSVKFGTELP